MPSVAAMVSRLKNPRTPRSEIRDTDLDGLLAAVPRAQREAINERAAIMEIEGGLGRSAAQEAALLEWKKGQK
jgi:hypothetical protein